MSQKMMIGKLMRIYRSVNDFAVRRMAKEIGISAATLSRIERGNQMDAKTMIKLMNWLFK